jgi:aflatoxin B1 aldehyde reductase
VWDICTAKDYILPTYYEGHYNPIGRHSETSLFPLLRKLNIKFNAYGTLAGGFLTKTPEFFSSPTTIIHPRWNPSTWIGSLYNSLYVRPNMLEGLKMWNEISEETGISKGALSFRWTAFHSELSTEKGDGMVVGAMKREDLLEMIGWLREGKLEESVVRRIEDVWRVVESEAPVDNFHKHKI